MAQHAETAVRRHLDLVNAEEAAHGFQLPHIRRVNPGDDEDRGKHHSEPQRHVAECDGAGDQDRHRSPNDPVIGRDDRETFAQAGQRDDHNQRSEASNDQRGLLSLRPGQPRPRQRGRDHQQRVFRNPGKNMGRDQAGKNSAEHAAQRHAEIEPREIGGLRTGGRHQAVADHRRDEERQQMQRDIDGQPGADIERERQHDQRQQERLAV